MASGATLIGSGIGNYKWPFSFGGAAFSGLEGFVNWADILDGDGELLQLLATSRDAGATEVAYLKIYNKANPVVGEDAPDIVLPALLGRDPVGAAVVPFIMYEDGEPGMYFDGLSIAVNLDMGTGDTPYTPATYSCDVVVQGKAAS